MDPPDPDRNGPGPGEFFLDEVPQLSRFNGENCTCTNGIAKQRYIRSNSFATKEYLSSTNDGHSLQT